MILKVSMLAKTWLISVRALFQLILYKKAGQNYLHIKIILPYSLEDKLYDQIDKSYDQLPTIMIQGEN